MKGIGQWASRPESWGPKGDPTHKKKLNKFFRTIFKIFSNLSIMNNLPIKFKGNFKNFCRIARKSDEEISEKVLRNFYGTLQVGNVYKVYRKTVKIVCTICGSN